MKKKIWIGTSWKMNKEFGSAEAWASAIHPLTENISSMVQPFVIPPFPYLKYVSEYFSNTPVKIGAQNMCWAEEGAFTGEVSPLMVRDCGASIVEIGHSERRAMFGETDSTVNLKVRSALANDLIPLVCVGDTANEKEWGVSVESVIRQVKIALYQVPENRLNEVIIAYEPVWAIGENGVPATKQEAENIHSAIRVAITKSYGQQVAEQMVLLYGGSVNLSNAAELLQQKNIDGLFVGRTAWEATGFAELISIADSIW